jgi:Beta-galactosidase, domain 3
VAIGSGPGRLLLLLADSDTASRFWVERTAGGPLLIEGAELLRTATVSGDRVVLAGDTSASGPLRVWAPARVRTLSWDSHPVASRRAADGALAAMLPDPPATIALPSLSRGWRFRFGSAERLPGFDDSSWPVADHQVTDNPIQPTSVYVGSASTPTSTHPFANMDDTPLTQTFTFPSGAVKAGRDNVVAVLAENMGQDELFENSLSLDSNKTPRGLESAGRRIRPGSGSRTRAGRCRAIPTPRGRR